MMLYESQQKFQIILRVAFWSIMCTIVDLLSSIGVRICRTLAVCLTSVMSKRNMSLYVMLSAPVQSVKFVKIHSDVMLQGSLVLCQLV